MIKEGDNAPGATFIALEGSEASAATYKGMKLILYFYPKDDTTGCTREAQDFSALAGDFAKAGAVIVGISKDTIKKHAKFIEKYDLKVDLGSDEGGAVCEAFGVWVEKSMYGRLYMGIERATFLIDENGKIARIWRKVKVAGHAADVLEAVKAL
jgi:thioredoxin-dependent peroxiredoxin